MKYCTKCGTACEDVYAFCPSCGSELKEEAPAAEQTAKTAPVEVSANVAAANAAIASTLAGAAPAEEKAVVTEEVKPEVAAPVAAVAAATVAAAAPVAEATPVVESAPAEVAPVAEAAAVAAATPTYVYEADKIPEGGKGRGLAGVSFAFGLLSLLFFWVPGFNIVFFILSILGIIFANAARKHYNYGLAIAGKVLSIFALVFNIILILIFAAAIIFGFFYISSLTSYLAGLGSQATDIVKTAGDFLSSILLVK